MSEHDDRIERMEKERKEQLEREAREGTERTRSRLMAAREAKEEADLFEQILESLPDGLVLVNDKGAIVFVNKQAELFFGYSREELIGQPHSMLIPDGQRDIHDEHRMTYQRFPHIRSMGLEGLSLKGRHKDGSSFPVDIMLAPIIQKEIFTVAVIRREIWVEHGKS